MPAARGLIMDKKKKDHSSDWENPQKDVKRFVQTLKLNKEAEENIPEMKDLDKEGLVNLYLFMHWLSDKGVKHPEPDQKEELEKLINQFEVESFAQMEKKPDFVANPSQAGILDTIKRTLAPSPKISKSPSLAPLTKKTTKSLVRKMRSGF